MGDDGLIKRAEQASQHQANAEASDNDAMGVLDKYIEDASKVEKELGLQVAYTSETAGKGAKVISLSYSIGTGEAAEQIEAKIEELYGETITEELRTEFKAKAKEIGITYEEYLLELLIQINLETEITEEMRQGLQAEAKSLEMTYQEYLEYGLEMYGISFEESLISVEDLEEMCKEELGIEITDENRESMKETATSNGMTYREWLEYVLNLYGVDTSGVTNEVEMGNASINCINSEFIATKNGTYTVKSTAKNGMEAETQIEITGIEEEKFSSIYETTATYTDASGATATIPAGFAVGTSEGINTIADGLVITDAVDEDGYSIGNEFVWIPVESDETFIRESFGKETWNETDYIEPYEGEETEYNIMRTQVLEYHGFYIGRYEAGANRNTFRNDLTEETDEVVVKRGTIPYNNVDEYDVIDLSKSMYVTSNTVTSTLIYGVQWDAMCRYIGDYGRIAETKRTVEVVGASGEDISKNIYDLAGNCLERTMERTNLGDDSMGYFHVTRGGWAGKEYTISNRGIGLNSSGNLNNTETSFRTTLYIK